MGDTIWVVYSPSGSLSVVWSQPLAADYENKGWTVHGPYDLRPRSCPVVARSPHAQPDECGIITGDETWCIQPEGHSGPHKLA